MDLKKINSLGNLTQPTSSKHDVRIGHGAGFREALEKAAGLQESARGIPQLNVEPSQGLKFSNHAVERMQSRGIRFSAEDISKLNEAVARAAAKGSKDTLVLMNDAALIVSVKNKTVVTVMGRDALKENVFTNIDSTIVM
ncbi:MAG: hypothetical protein N2578_08415 [Bdellovibrionaceae bacterium]|nr:hypothetical protein [Pseudobdellovibrionaceae bacterium]